MKTKIQLSVIIPVRGRVNLIKEAINSVNKQKGLTLKEIEIILIKDVDDLEVEKNQFSHFENVSFLINKHEEGPGGCRQTGLESSGGEFILFLDSDDQLKNNFFDEMSRELRKTKSYVGVICFSEKNYLTGFGFKDKIKNKALFSVTKLSFYLAYFFNGKNIFLSSFYSCQFSHMLFRRKLIKDIKFNYAHRRGGEDWDFFVKSLERGPIGIVPKKLIKFRFDPQGSTNQEINRKLKWQSYNLLISSLPENFRSGIFFKMLSMYIRTSK